MIEHGEPASGGGLTKVASGTGSAQNETTYIELDIPIETETYMAAYPTSDYSNNWIYSTPANNPHIALFLAGPRWSSDISEFGWVISAEEPYDDLLEFDYTVYEL
jgi:hypothetical protein